MAQITAQLNYLRMAPRKVRVAANMVKGKSVTEAEDILRRATRRAAVPLLKLLRSAVADAQHDAQLDKENLSVNNIEVSGGPTLKRFMPRAFGRASPIRKRTSHITCVLVSGETVEPIRKNRARKPERLVREATSRDFGEEEGARKQNRGPLGAIRGRSAEVVRRVFRRKVI